MTDTIQVLTYHERQTSALFKPSHRQSLDSHHFPSLWWNAAASLKNRRLHVRHTWSNRQTKHKSGHLWQVANMFERGRQYSQLVNSTAVREKLQRQAERWWLVLRALCGRHAVARPALLCTIDIIKASGCCHCRGNRNLYKSPRYALVWKQSVFAKRNRSILRRLDRGSLQLFAFWSRR